ncbi:Site-specific integrase [Burkholderia multivorans]
MAKTTHNLDDMQIRRWIAAGEPVAKSDGDGLTFTLSKAGTAAWVLRYRIGAGRRRELTLGNYPDLSLAAARKLARAHRAAIDAGADPAFEKKTQKARSIAAWTVAMLADDFEDKVLVEPLAEGTIYYRKADLEKVIRPKLGSMEVRAVQAADVVHMIEESKRSWTVCKRILTTTTQLFDHAAGKRMIDANPCAGIKLKAIMGPRPPVKQRVMLSEDELRTLLADVDTTIGRENGLALRILLATCVRSVELAKARWEHIDFECNTWFVPEGNVKTRSGFLVPVTSTVRHWFECLKAIAGDSEWVLPARTSIRRNKYGDTHVGSTTLWASIDRAFTRGGLDIRRFTPHDTRSTAKGHMRNMKIPNEITELALNHKLKGMERIYDVREDIPERREALERWAAFIVSCAEGRQWNVASFSSAA